jgi:hypothetical protein
MERTFKILGNGTELASVSVNHGVSEKIEAYFHNHPDFSSNNQATTTDALAASGKPGLIADELIKLAQLRDAGVLTEDEFATQKAKLLSN